MPRPPDDTSVHTHILRQLLTSSARSCRPRFWTETGLEGTVRFSRNRAARCMLGVVVLSLACHPVFISAPPVEMTALCTLVLDRGGGRDMLKSRPINPSPFAYPKALGTPEFCLNRLAKAHLPERPYLVTEAEMLESKAKQQGTLGMRTVGGRWAFYRKRFSCV